MWQSQVMRKSRLPLRSGLTENEALTVVALLAGSDIEFDVTQTAGGAFTIEVAAADHDRARKLLAEEELREPLEPAATSTKPLRDPFAPPELDAPAAWFGRGTSVVVALIVVCAAVFAAIQWGPEGGSRSRLLAYGAIAHARVEAGEHWRLVSAIFVHFDLGHLLSNMGTLLVLGPPLAHQLGGARFLVVFLLTGLLGNVASHVLTPSVALKGGASGAIAGVLGALGGYALKPGRRTRFRSWQVLGALAAFYGILIGFGPGRDNVAHVFGLLAGLLISRVIEPPEPPRREAELRALRRPPRTS